jgi:hypothetical protein
MELGDRDAHERRLWVDMPRTFGQIARSCNREHRIEFDQRLQSAGFVMRCSPCGEQTRHEVTEQWLESVNDPSGEVIHIAHDLERQLAARCECILGELLPTRMMTPEERAAHDEAPRPGAWIGDDEADGRELSQHETDALIRASLLRSAPLAVALQLRALVGEGYLVQMAVDGGHHDVVSSDTTQGGIVGRRMAAPKQVVLATHQRGGIDSDPMVRLLAYRAWGDRDRRWFEREGRPT